MSISITLATPPFDYTTIKDYTELVVFTSPVYFKTDTQKVFKITKLHSQYEGFKPSASKYQWIFARGESEVIETTTCSMWYTSGYSSDSIDPDGWKKAAALKDADGNVVCTITELMKFVADNLTDDEIAQLEAIGATVVAADTKPVYLRKNGAWVKQSAYERQNGKWVHVSYAN